MTVSAISFCSPAVCTVAALSLTQLIGWGSTFWLPAITSPAMGGDLGIALPMIMVGPTIMLTIMAIISWPLSGIFERYGARAVMGAGSPLGAIGLLIMGLANGPVPYMVSWLVLGVTGACTLTTPAQIALTEIAGEKARQALSMLAIAGALTSTIMWPLTGLLQTQWGWRVTTLIFAAIMLLVCTPLHWTVLARRSGEKSIQNAASTPVSIDRTRFILYALSFTANGFFTWGFALNIVILFEASGLDHTSALVAASFIGMAQWSGRAVYVLGGRRLSGFITGLVGSALFPVSFVVLLFVNDFLGAVLFAMLYGVANGISAITCATLPLEVFPPDAYARASAWLAVPLNLSFAAAPPIFTAIMISAGSHMALWLAFAISIFSFCTLLALLMMHRQMERTKTIVL